MDKLHINNMRFFGRHGVLPEETVLGQLFIVDLMLELDLQKAGHTDDLEATVNYAEVVELVKQIVEGPPYKLVEAVASRIASAVLEAYTNINAVTVRLTKPNPPVAAHFDGVAVEIVRGRGRQ
ncbi:dihydroneopterin aldolase [Paenibacillus turpanensis]|uniref:dihydroneopterin aldolase n=1 Tax=Paenibacillus turpanensis TaxID=2689078 RepID=UPI00140B8C93|nr:dihydroneopterin aldolase [Paenibacillus turpanensis]